MRSAGFSVVNGDDAVDFGMKGVLADCFDETTGGTGGDIFMRLPPVDVRAIKRNAP